MKKYIIRFLVVASLSFFCLNVSLIPNELGVAYYFCFLGTLITLLFLGSKIKLKPIYIPLIIFISFSIIFNQIPVFFRPIERFISFLIMLFLLSSFLNSHDLWKFRVNLFKYSNYLLVFLTFVSFIFLVLNININININSYVRSDFNGVYTHSMVLGPMSAISSLYCFYMMIRADNKRNKYIYIILIIISIITCIAAASRSALLGLLFSFFIFYTKQYRKSLTKGVLSFFFILIIFFLSYPYWKEYTTNLVGKFTYSQSEQDITSSRSKIWKDRIYEFESSPIIGIGFASVDTTISDNFEKSGGKIEPGSSWLAVLSMTGFFGFISLLRIILNYIYKLTFIVKSNLTESYLYLSILCFFIIHMFFEGYVFSAGSSMFFYFWLLLGNIEILLNTSINIRISKKRIHT